MLRLVGASLTHSAATCGVLLVAAGCGGDPAGPVGVTAVVSLAVGGDTILTGQSAAGDVRFPAADDGGATYLLVGQFATADASVSASVRLGGLGAMLAATPPEVRLEGHAGAAERFHATLRRLEAELAEASRRAAADLMAAPGVAAQPIVQGSKRTFRVCADLNCKQLKNVLATAQYVGTRAAVFLEDTLPSGGFNSSDIAQLGQQFDEVLHAIAVDAFGQTSDIDGNGVVMVLLTKAINAMVGRPECSTSFVTGFFFGGDLAPSTRQQYNNGEIFYGMVPDPGGLVSCAYSTAYVRRLLQVTYVHELQHMISFNQRTLVRTGGTEVLWLNEAMSHVAEELAARHYEGLGATATADQFHFGNLYNSFLYLRGPSRHSLVTVTAPGTLEERGAGWLFLRYVVDRFGSGMLRSLTQTTASGTANVEAATGQPFVRLVGRQALAVYAGDFPGFSAPPHLRYEAWQFRAAFQRMHSAQPSVFSVPFPLVPVSGVGADASVSAELKAGSGVYLVVTQRPGGPPFDLNFRTASGTSLPSRGNAQLAVVRLF